MGCVGDLIVVAGHRLLRECLASVLVESNRFRVVAEVESLAEVLSDLADLAVDLVLVDLTPPREEDLPQLLRALRHRRPEVRILLLGQSELEEDFLPLLEAGANGYLVQESSLAELEEALVRVLAGETLLSSRLAYVLFTRLGELGREQRRRRQVEALALTPRELEVLELVSRGCSNRQIAERLHLSIYTVKNHVHNILDKLEVEHREQAVDEAIRRRWLSERRPGRRSVGPAFRAR